MSVFVQSLSFAYGKTPVLEDISFSLEKGRLVFLLGPNGVGKSTLFKCMLGLLRDYSGTIQIDGQSLAAFSPRRLAQQIAYIPQSNYPAFNYTVLDMVLMGTSARIHAMATPGKQEEGIAMAALDRLGIADFANRSFMQISGGERQLVLIARALAQRSSILLMDEPTANLDYGNQIRVLSSIRALSEEGYSVLLSTHHPEQAFLFSHEIIAMKEGRLLATGTPKETITSELIWQLYGIRTEIESLQGDRMRICVPTDMLS
ncbi:ABC transporter ATP-binding protein [Eubacteriales bacterium OttesenSCG-928-A19]|nr:ABC transporter ATP-binding protein [Eubacteriales bacterium OttesenSCG-928-A19]